MGKYMCSCPGCNRMVDVPRSYCELHQKFGAQQEARKAVAKEARKPFADAHRENDALYRGYRWLKLRKAWITKHPACEYCGDIVALQVHHRIPPKGNEDLFFDEMNLETVCASCHRRITAREALQMR